MRVNAPPARFPPSPRRYYYMLFRQTLPLLCQALLLPSPVSHFCLFFLVLRLTNLFLKYAPSSEKLMAITMPSPSNGCFTRSSPTYDTRRIKVEARQRAAGGRAGRRGDGEGIACGGREARERERDFTRSPRIKLAGEHTNGKKIGVGASPSILQQQCAVYPCLPPALLA